MNRRTKTIVGIVAATITFGDVTPSNGPAHADVVEHNQRLVWARYTTTYTPQPGVPHATTEAQALVDMIAHHQDAIDAADRYLNHGTDPEVLAFAERLIRVQTSEVAQMRSWLHDWYPDYTGTALWVEMFCTIDTTATDLGFLTTMIEHHEMAIGMYRDWAATGIITHDELGLFARRIGRAQTGEVAQMHLWVARARAAQHDVDGFSNGR